MSGDKSNLPNGILFVPMDDSKNDDNKAESAEKKAEREMPEHLKKRLLSSKSRQAKTREDLEREQQEAEARREQMRLAAEKRRVELQEKTERVLKGHESLAEARQEKTREDIERKHQEAEARREQQLRLAAERRRVVQPQLKIRYARLGDRTKTRGSEEKLLPIPSTAEQVFKEWDCLGRPKFSADIQGRRALLTHSLASAHLNRSHQKCVIVLVGDSGVGKSSLVNHVFNVKLSQVSDRTSETRSVIEFTSKVDIPHLGVSDLAVSMVDTPGLSDTEGPDQDARNVFAIQTYLNREIGPGKLPNLILLLVKATDNRMLGNHSHLNKMVECLKMLKILDNKHGNLMVVFTHALQLPPKSAAQKIQDKKKVVQELLRKVCGLEVPVVFIENNPEEYELEFDEKSGTSRLPTGEIQPHHLFQAMMEMAILGGDQLGHVAIKEIYARGDQRQTARESCKIDATTKETGPLNKEEECIRNQLDPSDNKAEIEARVRELKQQNVANNQEMRRGFEELIEKERLLHEEQREAQERIIRELNEKLQKMGQTRSEAAEQVEGPTITKTLWNVIKIVASVVWFVTDIVLSSF